MDSQIFAHLNNAGGAGRELHEAKWDGGSCAGASQPSGRGEVNHVKILSTQLNTLLNAEDYADVVFIVEKERFPCHKIILATRCEYFRALLFGGMREGSTAEIVMPDTPLTAFKFLLQYLYTGTVLLKSLKELDVIDLLSLAHKYGLGSLENAIGSYLESVISIYNVTMIYDVACLYSLKTLKDKCLTFIDHNAVDVLETENFMTLSEASLLTIIPRDSFCAPEIKIFKAVAKWIHFNPGTGKHKNLLDIIRLPLISLHDLFHSVRETNLYSSDVILDAIQMKTEWKVNDMPFRGHLDEGVNLAQESHGAEVLSGEFPETLFSLHTQQDNYDLERGFTRHLISDEDRQGIVVGLSCPSIINTIKMLLWDKDVRSYSYVIECSLDNQNWVHVVDYSIYKCRSWQKIYFPSKVVRYIRVLGTYNSINTFFHLVNFQCLYTPTIPRVKSGTIAPTQNVANISASASLVDGVSRNRSALIDGNTENYDWESGYTCHQIGSGCITVQLAQPYIIGSMRMLLWDCDEREYSYYIEVSLDSKEWTMVADRRNESCKCWQNITFEPRPISFIKIVGTRNTANEVFHVVHFECPSSVA